MDGANLAWTFSAALYSKLGCKTRLPLSRGVTLAMECDTWTKMGLEPVAFMPESYVEGPLHGLADGGSLDTLVPGNVVYVGDSRWRNTVLWDLREAGRLVAVARPAGARDADDREILSFARGSNAMICSNDRYEDHIAGAGSSDASKELRRWLASNRTGGDVRGRKRDEGARGGVVGGKMKKGVKNEESPRNGYFYVLQKTKKKKKKQVVPSRYTLVTSSASKPLRMRHIGRAKRGWRGPRWGRLISPRRQRRLARRRIFPAMVAAAAVVMTAAGLTWMV